MKKYSRAIVVKDGKLLVMERHKMGQHYFTLLGGKVEYNETPEESAIREVMEESTIKIASPRLVFIEDAEAPYGEQHVFVCDYISGEPQLPADSEEAYWTIPDKNTYNPKWIDLTELNKLPFVSALLKEALIMAFEHGYPTSVYRFSSKNTNRLS